MMKRLAYASLLVLAVLPAHAATYYQPPSTCVPSSNWGGSWFAQATRFANNNGSSQSITCDVPQIESTTQDLQSARLYYDDNNANTTISDIFYCSPVATTESGSGVSGGAKYTCTTNPNGGCSSLTADGMSEGYLDWGNLWSSATQVVRIGFSCTLPANAGNGPSHVKHYRFDLVGN